MIGSCTLGIKAPLQLTMLNVMCALSDPFEVILHLRVRLIDFTLANTGRFYSLLRGSLGVNAWFNTGNLQYLGKCWSHSLNEVSSGKSALC